MGKVIAGVIVLAVIIVVVIAYAAHTSSTDYSVSKGRVNLERINQMERAGRRSASEHGVD